MEQLKAIKSTLVSLVQSQLGDLQHTDAKELGEVIDMIKDLEKAMYYCAIVDAMEKSEQEPEMRRMGYTEKYPHGEFDWDEMNWRPYYYYQSNGGQNSTPSSQGGGHGSTSYYGGPNYYYHEGKEHMGSDLKEVNRYLGELSDELPKMMEKSSPEEKKMVSEKLQQITQKVGK